jgi:WD40 repeat protein
MTAALGVILDTGSNTQKFFGGGLVDNTAKNVANDENAHTDDITSISISEDRNLAVSGQVGSAPSAFVWDAKTGQKKQRFKLQKGARGINAVAISNNNKYIACVDLNDDHNIYFFDVDSGALVWKEKGDTNKIFDVAFNYSTGNDLTAVTVGTKHIKFWQPLAKDVKKGLFGKSDLATSFACVTFDNKGICYTGGANSLIYVWESRENPKTISNAHKGGFICSVRWANGKLYSGGKDGNVTITDTNSLAVEKQIAFGSLIRAIDVEGSKALVGLRDGTIYHVDINSGAKKVIIESHSDGELWGLASVDDNTVITSADDNKIKSWDINQRKCLQTGTISDSARNAPKGGASTLSELPASQCSRGIAFNPSNHHVAVGHNDGSLTIRSSPSKLNDIIAKNQDSQEWIEVLRYSPDGSKLAVGSHDNNIYIYDSSSYKLLGKLTKHNSFIVSLDWS